MEAKDYERFLKHLVVLSDDECWLWLAARRRRGYGAFSLTENGNKKRMVAHRFAWHWHYGIDPNGLIVCHHCDNPPCCNPNHLFLGTPADNIKDMCQKGRLIVPRGEKQWAHKMTDEKAVFAMARLLHGEVQATVAESFGVTFKSISLLWLMKTWKHLWQQEPIEGEVRNYCRRGHKQTPENTFVRKDDGRRRCLQCAKNRKKGATNEN